MNITYLINSLKPEDIGREIYRLISELYPICRSITGNGFRETMRVIRNYIPLEIHEVLSGTKVFDWTVPKEWNIRDAYVKNLKGERVIDFRKSNLHVLNYSIPIKKTVSLKELKKHLYTLPDHPEWIPYRTSYYNENWGFCLSHNQFLTLPEGEYEVFIDSTLEDGHLTYGEFYLRGDQDDEVLISCHACHPSLCNDNLSGVSLVTLLAKSLRSISLRYSYRFLFVPATIGPITWLCLNEKQVQKIKHGLVVACVGDPGGPTYKKSRQGNAEIDKVVVHVLRHSGDDFNILEFSPYGYDERQYCSPAFNLPLGCLMRTPNGCFPEYHTSADNLDFIHFKFLGDSFSKYMETLFILDNNRKYLNLNPKGEPNLGNRGLYRSTGGYQQSEEDQLAILWVLNYSDSFHTLLDIAEKSGLSFISIKKAADALLSCDLLKEISI